MHNLESHYQTATRPLAVIARQEPQADPCTARTMLRPGQTANGMITCLTSP
jgi:hypothetical protein